MTAHTERETALRDFIASSENPCFVCSQVNPVGLHLHFERRDGVVRAEFTPGPWHQGWQGVIHGGILSAILDEAMAYTLFLEAVRAVTARMEVRYRKPVQHGNKLEVEAKITREDRKLADIEARIMRGSEIVAEAIGRFVKLGPLDPDELTAARSVP